MQEFLRAFAENGDPIHTLSTEEARQAYQNVFVGDVSPEEAGNTVGNVENREIPGPDDNRIPIRIYAPEEREEPSPVMVYFHGGGWVLGGLDTHDSVARSLTNSSAAMMVSVDYRLGPENPFPAAVRDAFAATRWVIQNAAEIGADPERVAIGGESAGGNLSTVTALQMRDTDLPSLVHQLLVYPVGTLAPPFVFPEDRGVENPYVVPEDAAWFGERYLRCSEAARNACTSPPYRPTTWGRAACDGNVDRHLFGVAVGGHPARGVGLQTEQAIPPTPNCSRVEPVVDHSLPVETNDCRDGRLRRRRRSVLPEPVDTRGGRGVVAPEPLHVGLAIDIDDVNLASLARVDVLEVVDDADHFDGVRDGVALHQELDLAVDVVLDEPVDRGRAVEVLGEGVDAVREVRFEQADAVFDPRRLVESVGQGVVGRRHRAAAGVADDDRRPGAGVRDRVEHVAGDDLAGRGPLDDAVADGAAGEHAAGLVAVPDVVLEDPGVRTADGDDVRPLAVLQVVEPGVELAGVLQVAVEELEEALVHVRGRRRCG